MGLSRFLGVRRIGSGLEVLCGWNNGAGGTGRRNDGEGECLMKKLEKDRYEGYEITRHMRYMR